ncbi:hypothetical protein MMC28_010511 [Mycoblastus sanguinarius]|nr:hypothetical protein [Mycoblastus sanguinarius]
MQRDSEDSTVKIRYVSGYPSLAAFIASDRDKSTAIYRRFDRLSARNLLYLQSELVELEARQDELDAEDLRATTAEAKHGARNWQKLTERASEANNVREKERLRIVTEISRKLREYREALILESTLLSLKSPQTRTLEAFRNVFHNVNSSGGGYPTLGGHSARILDDANDLTKITDSPLAYLSERRLRIVVAILNVILAAVLLFGAILNLYYVTDEKKRLGLIAGYTVAFAICVGLITKAKRSEVFGACAAYAAVLVVFVSGNLGNPAAGVSRGSGTIKAI